MHFEGSHMHVPRAPTERCICLRNSTHKTERRVAKETVKLETGLARNRGALLVKKAVLRREAADSLFVASRKRAHKRLEVVLVCSGCEAMGMHIYANAHLVVANQVGNRRTCQRHTPRLTVNTCVSFGDLRLFTRATIFEVYAAVRMPTHLAHAPQDAARCNTMRSAESCAWPGEEEGREGGALRMRRVQGASPVRKGAIGLALAIVAYFARLVVRMV